MIKIAICDDEEKNLDILTDLLKEYCQGKSVSFVVHKYINGTKLFVVYVFAQFIQSI